jgi:hypothetical protein
MRKQPLQTPKRTVDINIYLSPELVVQLTPEEKYNLAHLWPEDLQRFEQQWQMHLRTFGATNQFPWRPNPC